MSNFLDPIGPNLDDIAPNLTCSASSITTPTYNASSILSLCPVNATTTTPPDPSPTSSSNPTPSPNTTSHTPAPNVGLWAGLGVAFAVLLILLGIIIGGCVLYRKGAGVRGFYRTHENSNQDTPMVRYSASLRQLSSEVISPGPGGSKEPSHVSWSHKNGDYPNGGVPSIQPINRTESRDKEFYL